MPDPNNIVLTQHPLAFLLIPKVANTSIKAAMLRSIGVNAEWPGLNHFMAQATQNAHIFRTEDKIALSKMDDKIKVAFVRNPYDRIVSCYKDKVLRCHHRAFDRCGIVHGDTFEHFIRRVHAIPDDQADQHFRSQYWELYHNDKPVFDFLGHFETLQEDWKRLNDLVDIDLAPLPHHNKTDQRPFDIPLHLCALIQERYADDFRVFGYDR